MNLDGGSRKQISLFRSFVWIAFFSTIMGSIVWTRLQIVKISYDIHRLEKDERKIRDEVNSSTLKVNEARSPEKLEKLARKKFNMKRPRPEQMISLRRL